MSFVTVFTVGTMGFVLLVPILMVAVLMSTVSPLRQAVSAEVEEDGADDLAPATVTPLRRAA
ncbi:hypothetical protein H5V45_11265 [Nocardioides sp. KIGAM211]|uniref:Uncharacterized protein n=1 Tax=Nocardioides luti TaxID=2761101 RepID=A0A7X0VBE2_9ACTN|nr:hypothetical protein [Nocardioides luti]MBB6627897.1 hypothetical protein [Nocardioides luti]